MKLWGHGYWKVIAIQKFENEHARTFTHVLQRCNHCGKIREGYLHGDWTDYAEGIYED